MLPLLQAQGYESTVDFVVRSAEGAREGERPLCIAVYGRRAAEQAPALARRLLARGIHRFHVDCFSVTTEVAIAVRHLARAAGVTGHLTLLESDGISPPRVPATYDVHWVSDFLHTTEDVETAVAALDSMMSDSSALVVDEPLGAPGVPADEARDIVYFLSSKLLPRHGQSRDPDPPTHASRGGGLLRALEKRFAIAGLIAFGGLADPFVDPAAGFVFDVERSEDRRFVSFLGALEDRFRGALTPTRVIAALRKAGAGESPLRLPAQPASSREQLVIPEDMWFDFEPMEEVFAHELCGKADTPYLGTGFFDWEPDNEIRWAAPLFSVRVPLPESAEPHSCRVVIECHQPASSPGGGATLFANGARVQRIEDVYGKLNEDSQIAFEFRTHGGVTEVTCVFDRSQKVPDPVDDRELAIAVRRIAVFAPTEAPSVPRVPA